MIKKNQVQNIEHKVPSKELDIFWNKIDFSTQGDISYIKKGNSNSNDVKKFPELIGTIFCSKTKRVFAKVGNPFVFLIVGIKKLIKIDVYKGTPDTVKHNVDKPLYRKTENIQNYITEDSPRYTKRKGELVKGCNLTIHRRPQDVIMIYPVIGINEDDTLNISSEISLMSFGMNQASEVADKIKFYFQNLKNEGKSPFDLLFSVKLVSYKSKEDGIGFQDFGNLEVMPNYKEGKVIASLVKPFHESLADFDAMSEKIIYEKGNLPEVIDANKLEEGS